MPNTLPPGFLRTPARAPYAADAARSRGRLIAEPDSPSRTPFQRDRDRIIHSTAFRRLAHKTQVLVPHEGDHFRTRLTHSLEVAQIARSAARALGLDDDLAEALALAHDLGHTPFGHTGEDALDEAMAPYGGFDHNAQTLRIVTKLERRYAGFDGLNLTWETLEGLVKHNGPLLPGRSSSSTPAKGGIPPEVLELNGIFDLRLGEYPTAEAQVAAAADGIAYNAHDLDDGLRAGLISLEQTDEVEFICTLRKEIVARHPSLEPFRAIHELVRRTVAFFIEDLIDESWRRIAASGVSSVEEFWAQAKPLAGFSAGAAAADNSMRNFLQINVYRHPRLTRIRQDAGAIVRNLFARFLDVPGLMPPEWAEAAKKARASETARARIVCDYIAGMTDRYACAEHRRLFGETPDLRLAAPSGDDAS